MEIKVEQYPDKSLKAQYTLFNGKKHGMAIMYDSRGYIKKVCSYKYDKIHGSCKKYESGELFKDYQYKNGQKHGKCTKYDLIYKTKICTQTYHKGIQRGYSRHYDQNDNLIIKKPYKNGKINGFMIKYEDNQIIKKTYYIDDNKQGDVICFHMNGSVESRYQYVNNLREGEMFVYDSQERLFSSCDFKNGQVHGTFNFYNETGDIVQQQSWNQGMQHGLDSKFVGDVLVSQSIYENNFELCYKEFDQHENMKYLELYLQFQEVTKCKFDDKGNVIYTQTLFKDIPVITKYNTPDQFPDQYTCPVCSKSHDSMENPIQLTCDTRHIFCVQCINSWKITKKDAGCPLCRIIL